MSEQADDNVLEFGSGGRIYRDSRPTEEEQEEEQEPESPAVPPPPWADQPELPRKTKKQAAKESKEPQRPASVVRTVTPPEPPKEPYDWRETISTMLEVIGMVCLSTAGFLVATWIGLVVAGICMLVLGMALGRAPIKLRMPGLR